MYVEGLDWIGLQLDEPIKGTLILALFGMLDSFPGRGGGEGFTWNLDEDMGRYLELLGALWQGFPLMLHVDGRTTRRMHCGQRTGLLRSGLRIPPWQVSTYHGVPSALIYLYPIPHSTWIFYTLSIWTVSFNTFSSWIWNRRWYCQYWVKMSCMRTTCPLTHASWGIFQKTVCELRTDSWIWQVNHGWDLEEDNIFEGSHWTYGKRIWSTRIQENQCKKIFDWDQNLTMVSDTFGHLTCVW